MARLILLQEGQATPLELKAPETILGRHPDCTIRLDSNMVSRRHARILHNGETYILEDLGSGNGSFVNGKRIDKPTPLRHEDRIKLGPILMRFESQPVKSADAASRREPRPERLDATLLGVHIAEEDDQAAITDSLEQATGFGLLDVRPEEKLRAVIEISRSLAGTVELEALLPRILETLFEIFPHADRGCILLKDGESGKLIPRAVKHRRSGADESVKLSRTILRKVQEEKTGILSADAATDERFEASESISTLTIRSMMCVPMLDLEGETAGIIHIDTQDPVKRFRKDDLDLLMAIAGQAALSYESARLLVSHMEKLKQDNEMRIARNVQRSLLPEQMPQVDGYAFFASYEAAQAVGGDYYDCLCANGKVVSLAFGDVAGKGVPAALVMSRLSSVVQNTLDFVPDVGKAIQRINRQMCAKAVEGRFVTFVLASIDTRKHRLTLANAGHMAPMLRRSDGTIEEIGSDRVGIPLGIVEDYSFDTIDVRLEPGETILIYTDGVSEAMNPAGELYGIERLRELLSRTDGSPDEIGRTILDDVRSHADGRPQNDDITLMAFGRKAQG